MKTYNIVLVGCGYIGGQHLDDIYYRDNINILAVVDTDIQKAKCYAKKYCAKHYGNDYKQFVALDQTDIVIVSTNVNSHFEITELPSLEPEFVSLKRHSTLIFQLNRYYTSFL